MSGGDYLSPIKETSTPRGQLNFDRSRLRGPLEIALLLGKLILNAS